MSKFKSKEVMNDIYVALLNLVGIIISSLGLVWFKEWIRKRKAKAAIKIPVLKAECWMQLDKITSDIRERVHAKGVYIAYFHNGGKFCNGVNMDKFTVMAEDYDITIVDPYKHRYKNVMTSVMPYTILRLYRDGKYIFRLSEATEFHSKMYISDLKARGIKTTINILIRDLNTDMPIGFLSVEDANDFYPTTDYMTTLWKYHNKISRNMAMVIDDEII